MLEHSEVLGVAVQVAGHVAVRREPRRLVVEVEVAPERLGFLNTTIDGKKYAGTTRINGIIVPVTVRFEGRGVELWLDGKIVPMKLSDEVIEDINAVEVFDGKRDLILKVDLAD